MAKNSNRTEASLRRAFGELLPPAEELRSSLNSPTDHGELPTSYPSTGQGPGDSVRTPGPRAASPAPRRSRSLKTDAIAAAGIAATVAIAAGLLLVYGALDFSPNRALLEEAASGIARSVLTDSLFPEEDPILALAEDLTTAPELEIDAIHADVAGQLVAGSRSPASQ